MIQPKRAGSKRLLFTLVGVSAARHQKHRATNARLISELPACVQSRQFRAISPLALRDAMIIVHNKSLPFCVLDNIREEL
jgi:hypothetical protein